MTLLLKMWKATEVERWGAKEWWNGISGELGLICIPLLAVFIVACLALVVWGLWGVL